jgi:GPI inositol-deacylase
MTFARVLLLALSSLLCILAVYRSASTTPLALSAQGCAMSWMSPSYILQTGFDQRWTRPALAKRYSLWLYREVGYESNEVWYHDLFLASNGH